MSGWIALSRDITEHPVFAGQPERLYVWVWMLGSAAWKDTKQDANGKTVTVKRGQILTSLRQISKATGVGVQVIRTMIKRLETEHALNTDLTHGRMLVTICNYDKYQGGTKPANTAATQQQHSANTQKKQGNNITSSSNEEHTRIAVEIWNEKAASVGWSQVQKISKPRFSATIARLKDCGGLDGWQHAINRAAASDFLTGQTARPFFASFDWLTKPANFTKLMEGNYDNRTSPNTPTRNGGGSTGHDSLMAGFAQSAHPEPGAGGSNVDGGETAFSSHDAAMGGGQDCYPSQPLLRVIGSE